MLTPYFLNIDQIEERAAFFDVPRDAPPTKPCISVYKAAGGQMNSAFGQLACTLDQDSQNFEQALDQFETTLARPYSPLSHQSMTLSEEEAPSEKRPHQTPLKMTPFGLSRKVLSIELALKTPTTPTKDAPLSKPLKITPLKESSSEEDQLIHTGRKYLAEISHQQSLQFLARSEQTSADIKALSPSATLRSTATRMIQKALYLMNANNVEKKGFLTYHTRFHAAEMVIDTLKTLSEAARGWDLPLPQKRLLILLCVLCAAYHDAYFRGGAKRGMDEATCAEMLSEELQAPPLLRTLIYALIVGGTLPTFSGKGERPIMLPIASDPRFVDQTLRNRLPAPLKAAIATLGQMDVHRTETHNLRNPERIQAFDRYVTKHRKICGPSLNGIHTQLKTLAQSALKKTGFKGSAKQMDEWVNALLDKMGQNFRICLENSLFLTREMEPALPTYRAYLEAGRSIARGTPPTVLESKLDDKFFPAFQAEAGFTHFLKNAYEHETGHTTSLWAAHIEWMKAISEAFGKDPARQAVLLEYALLRAGCQDGVVFADKILSKDFDVMKEIDQALSPTAAPTTPFAKHRLSADAPATPERGDAATSTAAAGAEVGQLHSPPR